MIVAEVHITAGQSFSETTYTVGFDEVGKAMLEYERLKDLLDRREARNNDLPHNVTVDGSGSSFTGPLRNISAIAFADFQTLNDQRIGMKDRFPLLGK